MSYIFTIRSDRFGGNWSTKRLQFSSPTCVLKPCKIFWIMACRSLGGFTHDAIASQKNIKSGTTPTGFTVIMLHMPLNAESFSSLSRIWRNEVHLFVKKKINKKNGIEEKRRKKNNKICIWISWTKTNQL